MNAHYDYFYQQLPTDSIDIDDIGNCCISANNDTGYFWYLIIRTELGVTRLVEYGPYCNGLFPTDLTYSFTQFDYNEKKIDKIINRFLNNPGRMITQAFLVDAETIEDNMKTPMEYLYDDQNY